MIPRLLVDECVNARIILPPFQAISDCAFVRDLIPAADDEAVLALAISTSRVLLTEDAGFGRLIFALKRAPPPGVVLVTMPNAPSSTRAARVAAEAAAAIAAANGAMVVIDRERVRMRRFSEAAT